MTVAYPLTLTVDTTDWAGDDMCIGLNVEAYFFKHVRDSFMELDPTLNEQYVAALAIVEMKRPENRSALLKGQQVTFTVPMSYSNAEGLYKDLPPSFQLGFLVAHLNR